MVVGRRVEGQMGLQLPAGAVGSGERGGDVGRSGKVACVVQPDAALVLEAELSGLAFPCQGVVSRAVACVGCRVVLFFRRFGSFRRFFLFFKSRRSATGECGQGKQQAADKGIASHGMVGYGSCVKIG